MSSQRVTQKELILDYIKEFGSITPLEAIRDLGIYRLASRISDLKKLGYPVRSEWESVPNRYRGKSNIKRYYIQEGENYGNQSG